jgi:hypothetical protein
MERGRSLVGKKAFARAKQLTCAQLKKVQSVGNSPSILRDVFEREEVVIV